MDTLDRIEAQRRALADLVEGLSDDQWTTQSLCDAWQVRHVIGHLTLGWGVPLPKFLLSLVKHGGYDNANRELSKQLGERPKGQLTAELRDKSRESKRPPGFPMEALLSDVVVHTGDVAVPLGIDPSVPPETAVSVLDYVTGKHGKRYRPKGGIDGLRFVATDADWSFGDGPEVAGSALDLSVALFGRPAMLERLSGDGVPTFAPRFG